MPIFQTILVPTDYSEGARAALTLAARLAAETGARVSVAHVCQRSAVRQALRDGLLTRDDNDESVLRKVRTAHDGRLRDFIASTEGADASAECIILFGDAAHEIVAYAECSAVDLIVMGRRGVTLADVVLGSVAERVVRHAPCPVMIVKRRDADK